MDRAQARPAVQPAQQRVSLRTSMSSTTGHGHNAAARVPVVQTEAAPASRTASRPANNNRPVNTTASTLVTRRIPQRQTLGPIVRRVDSTTTQYTFMPDPSVLEDPKIQIRDLEHLFLHQQKLIKEFQKDAKTLRSHLSMAGMILADNLEKDRISRNQPRSEFSQTRLIFEDGMSSDVEVVERRVMQKLRNDLKRLRRELEQSTRVRSSGSGSTSTTSNVVQPRPGGILEALQDVDNPRRGRVDPSHFLQRSRG